MSEGTRIQIRVQPRAKENRIAGCVDGVWQVRVTAPPVEGEANEAVIALLAECLGLRKRAICLERGATGRNKLVQIEGLAADEVVRRLAAAGESPRHKRPDR